ncbi:hypothetical protein AB5I41_13900 [Sphingomonas sp. MMS24-JH45]
MNVELGDWSLGFTGEVDAELTRCVPATMPPRRRRSAWAATSASG